MGPPEWLSEVTDDGPLGATATYVWGGFVEFYRAAMTTATWSVVFTAFTWLLGSSVETLSIGGFVISLGSTPPVVGGAGGWLGMAIREYFRETDITDRI